jgi:hypothetical protein
VSTSGDPSHDARRGPGSPAADHWVELPVPIETAEAALRQAVEDWGGGFRDEGEAGELAIPVRAGLRQGYARLRPLIEPTATGSRLRLEPQDQVLAVNRSAVVIQTLGALGGVVTVLWPLHDSLQVLAPIGALLALVAWLMVASRFRSQGPDELLDTVAEIVEAGSAGRPGSAADH